MLKAILIDDEAIALDVLDIVLNEAGGVEVVGKFLNAGEALAAVAGLQPDLIFLDIEMPGMNGLAAAEKLCAAYGGARVIFVTAYQQYAVDAFDTGAIGYLLKPVSKQRLLRTLERFTGDKARLEQEAGGATSSGMPASSAGIGQDSCPPQLDLHVLGSMELYGPDRRLITWRTKKTKEMFAYLWHHAGEPVSRHRILDDLWPELTVDRAQALLHTTMYHLRTTLKQAGFPEMIMFGDERYWMRAEHVASDKERLEAEMEKALPVPGEERDLLSKYRGDYLEAEHYGWAEDKRHELRSKYVRWLEKSLEEGGAYDQETLLRKLIELDLYNELHYARLLRLLRERGHTSEVRRLTALMERRFAQELGLVSFVEPE